MTTLPAVEPDRSQAAGDRPGRAGALRAVRQHWPRWALPAAAAWSLLYGSAGLYWALGGAGFPLGTGDRDSALTALPDLRPEYGGPAIAVLGLAGVLVALAMAGGHRRRVAPAIPIGYAGLLSVAVVVLFCDYRMLVALAYAPIFVLGAPFGWPDADFTDAIPWPVLNQFIWVAGALLWAAAAVAHRRTVRGACGHCGRAGSATGGWTSTDAAAVWGRRAVAIAVGVPLVYAVTRWAWALGLPLGIDEEFYRRGQDSGLWLAGAALATLGLAGSLLTIGLVRPWGEVFPRWIPVLRGRRVPPMVATVPAFLVAVLVTIAGVMYVRLGLMAQLGFGSAEVEEAFNLSDGGWALTVPEMLWPVWGGALGAAALAYHLRRRGRCRQCGLS